MNIYQKFHSIGPSSVEEKQEPLRKPKVKHASTEPMSDARYTPDQINWVSWLFAIAMN